MHFSSPREALDHGIATVYQDLAVVPLMQVWRNFFLGSELRKGNYPLAPLDIARDARDRRRRSCSKMGIDLSSDIDQPIGTLSGGQRQCVAIARAVYFGARVLILDEPTAALGVKQSGVVLKYIAAARDAGLGVVFITHNPHHAFLVGDHFIILLKRGRSVGSTRSVRGHPRGAHRRDGGRRPSSRSSVTSSSAGGRRRGRGGTRARCGGEGARRSLMRSEATNVHDDGAAASRPSSSGQRARDVRDARDRGLGGAAIGPTPQHTPRRRGGASSWSDKGTC